MHNIIFWVLAALYLLFGSYVLVVSYKQRNTSREAPTGKLFVLAVLAAAGAVNFLLWNKLLASVVWLFIFGMQLLTVRNAVETNRMIRAVDRMRGIMNGED